MKNYFFKINNNRKRGFTLIETIFYLVFLVVLLGVVITLIVYLSKTYQTIQATKNLESSAIFSLERMTRDIKNATSVDVGGSSLATSTAGVLLLNTSDAVGNVETIQFYVATSTGAISVNTNGAYIGPLTLAGVKVSQLEFRLSTSTNSQAIKIDLGLTSTVGGASTTKNFYDTVVLRGSY